MRPPPATTARGRSRSLRLLVQLYGEKPSTATLTPLTSTTVIWPRCAGVLEAVLLQRLLGVAVARRPEVVAVVVGQVEQVEPGRRQMRGVLPAGPGTGGRRWRRPRTWRTRCRR